MQWHPGDLLIFGPFCEPFPYCLPSDRLCADISGSSLAQILSFLLQFPTAGLVLFISLISASSVFSNSVCERSVTFRSEISKYD